MCKQRGRMKVNNRTRPQCFLNEHRSHRYFYMALNPRVFEWGILDIVLLWWVTLLRQSPIQVWQNCILLNITSVINACFRLVELYHNKPLYHNLFHG